MARAHGYRAKLLYALEGSYGVAAVAGNFVQLPIISTDLGGEQPLEDDDTLGLGRDPQAPTYDMLKVSGQVVVPLDLRCIGYWLQLALGVTSPSGGVDPRTHTWVSGVTSASLPSATIEIQFPEVPAYYLYTGVMVQSIQLSVSRSGKPQMTVQLLAQNETQSTTSVDATPITVTQNRFHKFEGSVQHNPGTGMASLANLVQADMTYANSLATVDTVRADALVEGVDAATARLSGSLVSRLAATTLIDYAAARTGVPLAYVYTRTGSPFDSTLTLTARAAYLPKVKRGLNGPGGVESSYAWQGAKTATGSNDEMLQVVLVNDHDSYANGTAD